NLGGRLQARARLVREAEVARLQVRAGFHAAERRPQRVQEHHDTCRGTGVLSSPLRAFAFLLTIVALPAQAVPRLDTGDGVVDLYGKSYALVIGASGYQHWPKLPGVKRDVALVKAALEKHGFAVTTVMDPTRTDYDRSMRNFISKYG